MTHLPEIWSCIRNYLPRQQWVKLAQIYSLVELHINLDREDLEPQSPTSKAAKWKRNVRNVLQYRKGTGDIEWSRQKGYLLWNFCIYITISSTANSSFNKLFMATTFRFPQSSTIQWPPVCVVCGDTKTISDKSFGSSVDDFSLGIFLRISENRLTLTYPICKHHQFRQRAIRIGLLFVTAVAAITFVFLFQAVPSNFEWALWILICLTIFSLFILARVSEPVRVFSIVDNYFKVQIRNDIYAKAFANLNRLTLSALQN